MPARRRATGRPRRRSRSGSTRHDARAGLDHHCGSIVLLVRGRPRRRSAGVRSLRAIQGSLGLRSTPFRWLLGSAAPAQPLRRQRAASSPAKSAPDCPVSAHQIPIAPSRPGPSQSALSFPGGFRTPALLRVGSRSVMGRHPKPVTKSTHRRRIRSLSVAAVRRTAELERHRRPSGWNAIKPLKWAEG